LECFAPNAIGAAPQSRILRRRSLNPREGACSGFAKRVEICSSGMKVCGTPRMLTRDVRNSARASIQRSRGRRDKAERSPALRRQRIDALVPRQAVVLWK
jgi:hypothetical protein